MFVIQRSGQGSVDPSWGFSLLPGPGSPVSRIEPVLLQSLWLQSPPPPLFHGLCSSSLHQSEQTADGVVGVVKAPGGGARCLGITKNLYDRCSFLSSSCRTVFPPGLEGSILSTSPGTSTHSTPSYDLSSKTRPGSG